MKNWLIWVGIFFLPLNVLAKTHNDYTGDTMRYLTPEDTVFLSMSSEGEKVFTHTMEEKQTLYSLAKFYGLSLDELYFYNPEKENGNYGKGSEIQIPIPNRSIIRYRPKDYSPYLYVPIFYVVKRGETLFHIAQRVFQLPIDTIMDRNFMETPTLSIGQKLLVGWMSIYGIPEDYRQSRGKHPLWQRSYTYKKKFLITKRSRKEYRRKGPAVYIEGTKSTTDLLVMHRYAPIGSIIEITNPMKKRTIYAKVVAKIPPTYDINIEAVVSPRVGKMLGAIDKKFYVKTRYLK